METFILVALAVPVVTAFAVFGKRGANTSWQEAAKTLGLKMRTSGLGGGASLDGAVGSAKLIVDTVDHLRDRKKVSWTRIRASSDIPAGLMVGGDGFWRRWNEEQGEDSVEMAGVAFDDHVVVRGAIPEIFALLNSDARAQFRELEKRYRAFVLNGVVQVERQGVLKEPDELAKLVRRVARLAMALSVQGPSIADRLGANVVTDSNALVRQRNLEVLLERYPDTASAQLACQHAMGDRSYEVCVLAACHCGADGIPTLERVLTDEKAPTAQRLESLAQLAEVLQHDDAAAMLARTVENHAALRPAAVVMLVEKGFDPGEELLLELLQTGDPEGWIAFAKAITLLGHVHLTQPLEVLVDEHSDIDTLEFSRAAMDLHDTATATDAAGEPAGTDGLTNLETAEFPDDVLESEATDGEAHTDRIVIAITGELRVNLDVQRAAEAALVSLKGWSREHDIDELSEQPVHEEGEDDETDGEISNLELAEDAETPEDLGNDNALSDADNGEGASAQDDRVTADDDAFTDPVIHHPPESGADPTS